MSPGFVFLWLFFPPLSLKKKKKKNKNQRKIWTQTNFPRTKQSVAVAGGGRRSRGRCGAGAEERAPVSRRWGRAGGGQPALSHQRCPRRPQLGTSAASPGPACRLPLLPSHARRPITARAAPGAAVYVPGSCRWEEGGRRAAPAAAPSAAAKWRRNRCWEGNRGKGVPPAPCAPPRGLPPPSPQEDPRSPRSGLNLCVWQLGRDAD